MKTNLVYTSSFRQKLDLFMQFHLESFAYFQEKTDFWRK